MKARENERLITCEVNEITTELLMCGVCDSNYKAHYQSTILVAG